MGVEAVVRTSWHRAVRARGWPDLRTPASLDTGHLLENARAVVQTLWQVGAVPWLVLVLGAAAAALSVRRFRATPEGRTVAGTGTAALTSLLVVISVRHVRENGYNPRYLCLGLTLAVLGVSVLAGLAVQAAASRLRARGATAVPGAVGLGMVLLLAPVARPDPREVVLRPAAEAIAARWPGAVLTLGYWRTYALAALLPPGGVVPVPRQGEWNRRPDWVPALRSGRPVLVGTPDSGAPPPQQLVERGAALVLVEAAVLTLPPFPGESSGERVSLYGLAPEGR
jgi:hypothetical protein